MSQIIPNLNTKRPKATPFKQQLLSAYRTAPRVRKACGILCGVGSIYILIGIIILVYSLKISQTRIRYDRECRYMNKVCEVKIQLRDVDGPVFLYYELDRFYNNHRRFVRSRNYEQLRGENLTLEEISNCNPVLEIQDLLYFNSSELLDSYIANPCGLAARSYFNDTFELYDTSGKRIPILEHRIAWPSDIKQYHRIQTVWQHYQWTDVENGNIYSEHFINWMKTDILPDFIKLWGRIEVDLDGEYILKIWNNYDVSRYDTGKYVVFSNTNTLGGSQMFLAISFMAFGVTCLISMCAFWIKAKITTERLYMLNYGNSKLLS